MLWCTLKSLSVPRFLIHQAVPWMNSVKANLMIGYSHNTAHRSNGRSGMTLRTLWAHQNNSYPETRGMASEPQTCKEAIAFGRAHSPTKRESGRIRLWFNGWCIRLRTEHEDRVCSYGFVAGRTDDGRLLRIPNGIDEYTKEGNASRVERKIKASNLINTLSEIFISHDISQFIRSDNGSGFVTEVLQDSLHNFGVTTAFIEPGSPWDNGYIESFNRKFRDELANREMCDILLEMKVVREE